MLPRSGAQCNLMRKGPNRVRRFVQADMPVGAQAEYTYVQSAPESQLVVNPSRFCVRIVGIGLEPYVA